MITRKHTRGSKSTAINKDNNLTRRRMKVPKVEPLESSVTPAQDDVLPETQIDENLNE